MSDEVECAREGCEEGFVPRSPNNIYHNAECLKIVTRERMALAYRNKKAIENGFVRTCQCGVKLSRYNPSMQCSACEEGSRVFDKMTLASITSNIV